MLKLFQTFGSRLIRSQIPCRRLATEVDDHFDDKEKRMKMLELEIDLLCQEGMKVPPPEAIRPDDWEHILGMKTKSARRRFYAFLWRNQMIEENRVVKKAKKSFENKERLQTKLELDRQNDHIVYGLHNNSMFLRIYDATMTKFHNSKLFNAMMYGQKLIFDCSYDEYMNRQEASNCAKQLMLCFAENRMNDEPFDLQFCNMNPRSYSYSILNKFIPTMNDIDFPINVHEQSYLDLYDKKQLVYLTPHCRNELETYSHDNIYIIGAMVDKTNNDPLSLAKAKKQGLRMAKLPLDRYLHWNSGSGKSLTLNQVMQILYGMKTHGNWNKALEVVPRRKLVDYGNTENLKQFDSSQNRQNYRDKFDNQQNNRNQFDYNQNNRNNFDYKQNNRNQFDYNQNNRNQFDYKQNNRNNYDYKQNNRPYRDQKKFSISQEFYNETNAEEEEHFAADRRHKEQKNFDKFKFNLQTWGSTTRKSK